MGVKILVVCGGTGRGLLGQVEASGFHAEVQIDAATELVSRPATDLFRKIGIDQGLITQRLALDVIVEKYTDDSSPTRAHAEVLYRLYPVPGKDLGKGLARTPCIGGAAMDYRNNDDALTTTFMTLFQSVQQAIGPNDPINVWIIASAAGGTGAGIRRRVAEKIASIMHTHTVALNLHFLTFGAASFYGIDADRTRLNAFFCVASDAAFGQIITQRYPNVVPNFYYVDIPDVGRGGTPEEGPMATRAELVRVVSTALFLDELQTDIEHMIVNSPNRTLFARVGFWGAEFDQDQLLYETLREIDTQMETLCDPDPSAIVADEQIDFQPSQLLAETMVNVADLVRNNTNWKFPRRPFLATKEALARYPRSVDIALDNLLPRHAKLADLTGQFEVTHPEREAKVLAIIEPRADAVWLEEYNALRNAHWVQAWCGCLLSALWVEHEELLETCSAIQYKVGPGAAAKATELAQHLPRLLEVTIQIRLLKDFQNQAFGSLQRLLARVHQVSRHVKEQLANFADTEIQRYGSQLIEAADLGDILEPVGHHSWFEIVERAIRLDNEQEFRTAVKKGATGLTRAGLARVLGLPEGTRDLAVFKDKLLASVGGMRIKKEIAEGHWWQAFDFGGVATELYRYRVFPKLNGPTAEGLGIGDTHNQVQFLESRVGEIGLRVLAVELAVIGVEGDTVTAPRRLLEPFFQLMRQELARDWPDDHNPDPARPTGLRNLAMAAVVGDPLYGPLIDDLGFREAELRRLKYLFELYYPATDAKGKSN